MLKSELFSKMDEIKCVVGQRDEFIISEFEGIVDDETRRRYDKMTLGMNEALSKLYSTVSSYKNENDDYTIDSGLKVKISNKYILQVVDSMAENKARFQIIKHRALSTQCDCINVLSEISEIEDSNNVIQGMKYVYEEILQFLGIVNVYEYATFGHEITTPTQIISCDGVD